MSLTVAPERVQRLIDAVSMIAVGEFATALEMVPEPTAVNDAFDLLEACVHVLVGEVEGSQAASARAAQALEESRQQLADKLELIQRQSIALKDLSTPIIEVWEHTLALPIVGAIDGERAATIAEELLRSVAERRARHVLLDLTGVETIDPETFEHLARLVRAVGLLGTRCALTGLSPSVAAAVVAMNIDLGAVKTHASLKDGLRAVLLSARSGRKP
jgi:rsbT co-antagonist protein RsbR